MLFLLLIFLLLAAIVLLPSVTLHPFRFRRGQCAFTGKTSQLHPIFVDSGAFPEGIYRESYAFSSLQHNTGARICGLFSSSAPVGAGTVSMWVPVVHRDHEARWLHCSLKGQLYSPRASQSLFSTQVVDSQLNAVPFLTRRSHCIVFPDGWVAPLSPTPDGIFLDVVRYQQMASSAIFAMASRRRRLTLSI